MGIDKADIRFVIQYQMRGSLDAYYQETGRAGRDGEPADCALLFDLNDRRIQQFFLAGRYPSPELAQRLFDALAAHCKENAKGATLVALKRDLAGVGGGKLEVALNMLVDVRIAGRDRQRRYRLLTQTASNHAPAEAARESVAQAAKHFEQMSAHDGEALQKMIDYAQTAQCRWRVILDYYGDTPQMERCGVCDNCVNPPQIDVQFVANAVATGTSAPTKAHTREPHRWAPGDPVRVPRYGAGEVALASGDQVAVRLTQAALPVESMSCIRRSSWTADTVGGS